MKNLFHYRWKMMMLYCGWRSKDVAAMTGYSDIWVRKCSTSRNPPDELKRAINYFESNTDHGSNMFWQDRPVKYEIAPKGEKNWELIKQALEKALK